MEGIVVLAIIAVLAIPVSVVVLFVMVSGLRGRIAGLERQLAQVRAAPVGGFAADLAPAPNAGPQAADLQNTGPQRSASDANVPTEPAATDLAIAALQASDAQIAAVGPWDRALATPDLSAETAPPKGSDSPDQNRALVLSPDRIADLTRWVQTNWVYVISAASLALAGVFFVQYGVERGLLPPGLRVLAALLFGAGLVAAGEWLRRRHGDEGATSTIHLPSVFSGAGVVTLFAAVLAARQLYGLIGPGLAFAGHLATAVLAVGLGWLCGPLLVAVGLIGAAAAPFVVGGSSAQVDWLYGYFALIAVVGLGVDAIRRWAWVSVLALVLAYGGGALVHVGAGSDAGWVALLLALALVATVLPELRLIPTQAGPATLPALLMRAQAGWPPFPVRLVLGATAVSSGGMYLVAMGQADTALLAMTGLAGLAVAFLIWAEKAEGLADLALMPTLALLAATAMLPMVWGGLYARFDAADLIRRAPETAPSWIASVLLGLALLVSLAAGYRALRQGPWGVPYGLAAVLTAPLSAAVLELFWQPARVLGPYVWALQLIGLAALMTALALRFARVDGESVDEKSVDGVAMRRAAHATLSALALIALALFVLTTKTALTLALAVLVVVAAALDRRFRLPEMSLFLQLGAAALSYRLLVDPGLGWALDAPLVQVLLAFAGTIAAMVAALWLMRPHDRPIAKAVAESAAAGLTAILVNVLITRWLNTAEGYQLESHWAVTLNSLPWVVLMLVQLYRARLGGRMAWLRRSLAALGGVFGALGLATAVTAGNPLFSYAPDQSGVLVRGPYLLDTLFVAYGVPGLMLVVAAWRLPGLARRLRLAFLGIGAALLALFAGLEIRRFWQGDWLGASGVLQGELYCYTLALMLLGAALLYQAIAKRSDTLRRLAMAVIALTVAKVFLLDAAGLSGLTRVVSFAGLGLSLAGLAWLNRWAGSRS